MSLKFICWLSVVVAILTGAAVLAILQRPWIAPALQERKVSVQRPRPAAPVSPFTTSGSALVRATATIVDNNVQASVKVVPD